MRPEIETKLAALPALDPHNLWRRAPRCKVCRGRTRFFDVVDFNKHCSFEDPYAFGSSGVCVPYYQCRACSFLFTDFFEGWTNDDFSRFVYNADYIKVDSEYDRVRPARLATSMGSWLRGCESARILDYGSGTGAFSREMRNVGFTCIEDYDPFSSPGRPLGRFDIITCFEVIEHTPDPIEAVRDMRSFLAEGGCIIFSQTLQPPDLATQRGNWWYLGPRNGHISTFAAETLAVIADAVGLVFHFGKDPYAFASPAPSPPIAPVVSQIGPALAYARLYAPPEGKSGPEWYPIEDLGGCPARWTGVSKLQWPMPQLLRTPCTLRVGVPVIASISADFAEACRVEAGEQIVLARFRERELCAEITVNEHSPSTISLITPEPISPRAAHGIADDRPLGLAIEVLE